MKEIELWQPDKRIPFELLDLDGWSWDENGLSVVLSDGKKRYKTFFQGQVISFRSTLESVNFKFRDTYGEWRDELKLNYAYSFFKLNNSEYINWLKEQNYNLYDNIQKDLIHYVFVTEDEIIEILNDKEPIFDIEIV